MITKAFRGLSARAALFVVVVLLLLGMWLWITPLYDYIKDTFEPTPIASFVVGAFIVFVAIKLKGLRPW